MSSCARRLCGIVLAGLFTASVFGQTNEVVLTVRGAVDQPLALSLTNLHAMDQTQLSLHRNGEETRFEGVPLYDVVNRARPRLTEKCCSNAVNTVVVVKAADHYQAVFLMSELDPKFGHQQILLAYQSGGQPLDAAHGPLQIVVPEDKLHARWVRQVNGIEVISIGDLGAANTNAPPH